MSRERFKNQFRSLIGNPFNVIVLITLLLLFTLIVIPLLAMVQNTFVVAKAEVMRRTIPGAKIGDGCIIGAHSVVKGEIPAYSMAVGSPARVVKRYNFEKKIWER